MVAYMLRSWKFISLVTVVLLGAASLHVLSTVKNVANAYLYAYPLVLMAESKRAYLNQTGNDDQSTTNRFRHIRDFPDHSFREVVRPNNDTLYSVAWLDLDREPVILSVPDTKGRYYVMPFMDAWTNVFAMVGKRTTGTQAGSYAIVGPNWKGSLPQGLRAIAAPTPSVWLIGRIQTNGADDVAAVAQLQAKFTLTTLSRWAEDRNEASTVDASVKKGLRLASRSKLTKEDSLGPMEKVDSYSANEFFKQFARLVAKQGALEFDEDALTNMRRLGLLSESLKLDGRFEKLGPIDQLIYTAAITITQKKLADSIRAPRSLENGWSVHRSIIGDYGDNYNFRAAVAKIGLGALPIREAAYPNAKVDKNGDLLDGGLVGGRKAYRLHFEAGELPPVNAFWSLSLYDEHGYFIENPINRYAIGDRDKLHYNADGSLDILIQATKPDDTTNWLPAPSQAFALTMRLYSPQKRFLDKAWTLPPVEPLN